MKAALPETRFRPTALLASLAVAPEDLAGATEIAELLGVERRTVFRYVDRPDFPEPVGQLARGRVWRRADVEAWAKANLPLPTGRPPVSWKVVAGPRTYDRSSRGADIDVGWAFDLARGAEKRTVWVEVAGGRLQEPGLPEDCVRAIRTSGRSAVNAVRHDDDPPSRILVTSSGLRELRE